MKFYSILNKFSNTFNAPFPCENDSKAVYQVRQMVNGQANPPIIAEDFALYSVGEFDETSGCFTHCESVELIADLSALIRKKVNE